MINMRKLSAGVILVMMLCANAYADIVYTTDTGNLGLIKTEGSTSADFYGTQYTGAGSNTLLGSYWNGSATRVILVRRTADTSVSGDTALIFDPANLAQPFDSEGQVLAGLYNAQALVGSKNGRGLFFASGASIHEFQTWDFEPSHSYTYTLKTSDDIIPDFTGLLAGTYNIFALAERENSADMLLVFDGQLRDDIESFGTEYLPSGTSEISWLSNSRVAAAHTGGVSVWGTHGFVPLVSTDAPVKSLCQDSGNGFYFAEQVQSGDTYTTALKHYSSGEVITLSTGDTGSSCRLLRDDENNILAAITGSRILVYNMKNDTLIGEYGRALLGGLPVDIAISHVKGEESSSNNGCDVAGAGVIMILAGALIFRKP